MSVRLDRAHVIIAPGSVRARWIRTAAQARGMSREEYMTLLVDLAMAAMDARIAADRALAGKVLRGRGGRR